MTSHRVLSDEQKSELAVFEAWVKSQGWFMDPGRLWVFDTAELYGLAQKWCERLSSSEGATAAKPAWRFTGPTGLKKYLTQAQYEAQTDGVKRWYEPYHCASCSAPQPAADSAVMREALRELVEIETLKRDLAKVSYQLSLHTINGDDAKEAKALAEYDMLSRDMHRRQPAAWDRARSLVHQHKEKQG